MKSFRLTLNNRDRMLLMRLGQLTHFLKLHRLSIWLYKKAGPFGEIIAAFVMVELMLTSMVKSIVVQTDA